MAIDDKKKYVLSDAPEKPEGEETPTYVTQLKLTDEQKTGFDQKLGSTWPK